MGQSQCETVQLLINPRGIAMPKGFSFIAVVFFLSCFFSYLLSFFIPSELLRHLPPRARRHKRFLGPTLNFDRTYLCNETWYQQSGKKLSVYRNSLTRSQIWWTLVQKRLRTVGEFLPTSLIFALGDTASLTAWTLRNRQQANFGTLCGGTSLQSRTTECRAGSRWALTFI